MFQENADLEAAILAVGHSLPLIQYGPTRTTPESRDPWHVYSDWLQQRGDPRGELMAVQLALELRAEDPELRRREQELVAIIEPLWRATEMVEDSEIECTFYRGLVHNLTIRTPGGPARAASLFDHLMRRPSAQLVWGLDLVGGQTSLTVDAMVKSGVPRALRKLVLWGAGEDLGTLATLSPTLQHLEALSISASSVDLGAVDLPALEWLSVSTVVAPALVHSLCSANRSTLKSLRLSFDVEDRVPDLTLFDPIFESTSFPNLKSLDLQAWMDRDSCAALGARVAATRLLSQLDDLALHDPDAVRALLGRVSPNVRLPRITPTLP